MATTKRENRNETSEKNERGAAAKTRIRSLTVRSGITAGLARAGCTPCHRPNHNETLVAR